MSMYTQLTPDEERVILYKGTEQPGTGEYYLHDKNGVYLCKRCRSPLFDSSHKFHSACGWPSFDNAIDGAVRQIPDSDGVRTEIVCAHCGAHLGHVFHGEGFTPKNVRLCVNSISLDFEPRTNDAQEERRTAIFAGGCFWGVEYYLQKAKGVIAVTSGYTGGSKDHPSYEDVSHGTTGHAEAVEVIYDPSLISYEELARLFFEIHDPTELNRQGPDIGFQYRSAVFYVDEEQKKIAAKLIAALKEKGFDVVTTLEKAGTFWPAETYHQDYYEKTGHHPYCHIYKKRF